ncbi:MAG TPA: head GIN domain-containing protein [Bryobacteraceae bacterium]
MALLALFVIAGTVGKTFAQSEETRSVSGYHGIASGGSFIVTVKIDGTESLRLKGDPEDLQKIETVVENGVLKIRYKKEYERRHEHIGRVDVYVTAKALSSVSLGGSGSINVDGVVKGDKMKVSTAGSGTITTAVEGGDLDVSIAGSGDIMLKGKAGDAQISIAGSGSLKGADLKTDGAEISIAGSGDVRMDIAKSLSAHIAGSGSVTYTGSATVSSITSAGSGRVTRMK